MEINILSDKFLSLNKKMFNIEMTEKEPNVTLIHQAVKQLLASRRQGNAQTKNKALVSGGGKKPFKQKGTGNARQGSKRSPLMPGGGTVFGPQKRDFSVKLNKKMMIGATKSLLLDKHQAGKLYILESFPKISKTKDAFKILGERNLLNTLFVVSSSELDFSRSVRNLPGIKLISGSSFSVYEGLKYENIIFQRDCFEDLLKRINSL